MFLDGLIRRRLLFLLSPWLRRPPELDLNVGIFRSHAVARDVQFDAAALSGLSADSSGFLFEEITIGELDVRFSTWSAQSLTVEVRDVNVVLSVRELKHRRAGDMQKSEDDGLSDMRKKISAMDPEGAALHEALRKLSDVTPSTKGIKASILNAIYRHSLLEIHDIKLQLQFPVFNDGLVWVSEAKELTVFSEHLEQHCLLRDIIGMTMISGESSFVMDLKGFEIGFKRNDQIANILYCKDLLSYAVLKDLHLVDLNLHVPELKISSSPQYVAVLLPCIEMLARKAPRNGRYLWNIAARKISSLILIPRVTLYRVMATVLLWLRYLHRYEDLLSLVGYPSIDTLKESALRVSRDKTFMGIRRHRLKVISNMEKELQPEAIVRARRIGRHRVLQQSSVKVLYEHKFSHHLRFLFSILGFLICVIRALYKVIKYIVFLDFLRTLLLQEQEDGESLEDRSKKCLLEISFGLNIETVLITISLDERQMEWPSGISYSDFILFSVTIGAISLKLCDNILDQSLLLACGKFSVSSAVIGANLASESGSRSERRGAGGKDGNLTGTKTIVWGEPLADYLSSAIREEIDDHPAVAGGGSYLRKFLGEMWTKWQSTCVKFQDTDTVFTDNIFVLFEMKSYLIYPGSSSSAPGFLKCNLMVGKLNVALECSSTALAALLFRRMSDAFCWQHTGRENWNSVHPRASVAHSDISWMSKYRSYLGDVKVAMLEILPEKHIEIGAFIAGPVIHISFQKEGFVTGKRSMNYSQSYGGQLAFELHDIEIAIWPTSESDFNTFAKCNENGNSELRNDLLEKPFKLDTAPCKAEKYMSQTLIYLSIYLRTSGLKAYMENFRVKQKMQFLALNPFNFQLSSFRKCVHLFSGTSVSFSAAFSGIASGIATELCMDEIHMLSQAVLDVLSETILSVETVPNGFNTFQESVLEDLSHACINGNAEKESSFLDVVTSFHITGTLKFCEIDLILQKSRNSDVQRISGHSFLDSGIRLALKQTNIDILCEERKMEVLVVLSKIQSTVSTYESQARRPTDHSLAETLALSSNLYETSFSDLTVSLSWGSPQKGTMGSEVDGPESIAYSPMTGTEGPSRQSSQMENFSDVMASSQGRWLFISVSIGETILGKNVVKDILLSAHDMSKLLLSLSVGGEFQMVSLEIQGGLFLIEIAALAACLGSCESYVRYGKYILQSIKSSYKARRKTDGAIDTIVSNVTPSQNNTSEVLHSPHRNGSDQLKSFTLEMSRFSLVLAAKDERGVVREILLESDMNLKFEVAKEEKNFQFDLLRFSIASQALCANDNEDIHVPHFSSIKSGRSSPITSSGNLTVTHGQLERNDANDYGSSSKDAPRESSRTLVVRLGHKKFILQHCHASLHTHTIKNGPASLIGASVGGGSISGVDITISLSEIEMILSAVESLPGVSNEGTTIDPKAKQWSNNQDMRQNFEEMVPNGAIVAIQDVDQHMYFAVDGGRYKSSLVGVLHYSLVGEQAFFRINYHDEGRWRSSNQWFSIVSLNAKDESGKPLCLTYRRGSGFLEVTSGSDSRNSLFRAVSYKPESVKGDDVGWNPYNQLVKGTFYLLTKKNDLAIAFVNGIPELVGKPGNPFKLKLFQETDLCNNFVARGSFPLEGSSGTNLQHDGHITEQMSAQGQCFPSIDVKVEKLSLTIVHDLLGEEDMFPLLRGSIDNVKLIGQILPAKLRMFCTMMAWLDYFSYHGDTWRHLVKPVEVCIYGRRRFPVHNKGAPLYLYCRTKELGVLLNEVPLDIILFVIGKLDIAGPFSVKSATIIPNRCKVENQTGATLLCQFNGQQLLKIAKTQSAYVQLKRSVLTEQESDDPPAISVRLGFLGSFTTSPINIPLSEDLAVAWRTQIVSLDGSKNYPGPFLVLDIARRAQEGLLIVVSPLIRVHNETNFSMELRFQRPQQEKDEAALAILKKEETLDDSMAMFDAINLSGGLKKTIASLTLGNFLLSFRPEIPVDLLNNDSTLSVGWSDDIEGGKAVRLSGVFDKLSYKVRRALSSESIKVSFSTACCTINSGNSCMSKLHFFLQSCTRDVPIRQPDNASEHPPVALQEQKEIFLLPTVRISNYLLSEINVALTDSEHVATDGCHPTWNQATISCGSTADFYANPAIIYFNVTLTSSNLSCKPLNSSDWVKKLLKNRKDISALDVDLDFGGGKYIACLRLSRGHNGILEAFIFTPYVLKNKTGFPLFICTPSQKPPSRDELRNLLVNASPDVGLYLPQDSSESWFQKSTKLHIQLLGDEICEAILDLNSLSGLSEVRLDKDEGMKCKYFTKFGITVAPAYGEVPAQLVTMCPRYVVVNNSDQDIMVQQCFLEDDTARIITVKSAQRAVLMLHETIYRREFSLFENFIRKHKNSNDDSVLYVQFLLSDSDYGWSGPVCVASLGRFFLKFKREQLNQGVVSNKKVMEFANVNVVEEGSSLTMHFHRPPNVKLPYRIENRLRDAIVTYYQKDLDSPEPEFLQPECSTDYVWDDLTRPHKLLVHISDIHQLHEINLDKVREWKPFFKVRRYEGLASRMLLDKKQQNDRSKVNGLKDFMKVGYEVYADGPTRVLRISEMSDSLKVDKTVHSSGKIRLRIPHLAIHMFELKDLDGSEPSADAQLLIARLGYINIDALFTDHQKYSQMSVQSLDVVPRWVGAPFAAMLRRHRLDDDDSNDCIKIVIILQSTSSTVRQVKYSSIIVQPLDLNLDEESLMKLVPFWRSSLSQSNTPSRQYYFDHFEIHPIKIFANFLPGDSYASYCSAQETLRSFIHSVVKIPPMRNVVVELNGVLVTHALVTMRELSIRCAQHYTWYAMRAIYVAKGSPLLPPGFASIFDDLASSSLDVFFDPSHGLMKLPGLTLGTFKLLSKSIGGKGFSGTKRYLGDLRKTLKSAGSNVLFAAVTEVSDSILKGAETSGFDGMVRGFRQGILKLAMEPSVLGSALLEGGPDRVIKLDGSPGVDELYIEGYLQAMLDTIYKQEYLRVRVIDNQVILKNLPPSSSLIEEIMDRVREFLVSKALLKGDPSASSRPLRHLRGQSEWRIGPTVLTLCEHLFVSFAIRMLRNQASKATSRIKWKRKPEGSTRDEDAVGAASGEEPKVRFIWRWGLWQFVMSGVLAYVDGRLCRCIPNHVARRIVSGFLLSFLDKQDNK